MKRNVFIRSILGLIIAPQVVNDINFEEDYFSKPPIISGGLKYTCSMNELSGMYESRTMYGYFYDHIKNKGSYTAYLKNGNKITFPVHEYNPDKWQEDYGYLSEKTF